MRFSLFIFIFLFACGFGSEADKDAFTIETFEEFPTEIDGCSCYFGETKKAFQKQQYIYVDDYKELIVLKINGQFVKFAVVDSKEIQPEIEYYSFAKSEKYTLSLTKNYLKQSGDEVWSYNGTFKVKDHLGNEVSKTFYGDCGC